MNSSQKHRQDAMEKCGFPQKSVPCSQNHNPVNMKKEIQPQETSRAEAFKMWMSLPQPMGASPSITVNL